METGFVKTTGRYTPRYSVQVFAEAMEGVLQENDHKGGWYDCPIDYLETRLLDEVEEWKAPHMGIKSESKELIDIANFCMMIYHRSLDNTKCYG